PQKNPQNQPSPKDNPKDEPKPQDQPQDQKQPGEQKPQAVDQGPQDKAPAQGASEGKIGKKEAEKLLDSLAQEEKRDLRKRLAHLPQEQGREKDWGSAASSPLGRSSASPSPRWPPRPRCPRPCARRTPPSSRQSTRRRCRPARPSPSRSRSRGEACPGSSPVGSTD